MTETASQSGTWYKGSDLDLDQLRKVLEAMRDGDFSQRMPTGMGYKAGSIARVINSMANMLEALSAEHMRVAEECGTHGSLGCQAEVDYVSGRWKEMTDAINRMAVGLTVELRRTSQFAAALARGENPAPLKGEYISGEVAELQQHLNDLAKKLESTPAK